MYKVKRPIKSILYLTVANCADAIKFYQNAFDMRVIEKITAADAERIVHVHLRFGGFEIYISDLIEESNLCRKIPENDGLNAKVLHWVFESADDLDGFLNHALAAGAKIVTPFENAVWAQYFGEILDPFGHVWALGSPSKKNSNKIMLT